LGNVSQGARWWWSSSPIFCSSTCACQKKTASACSGEKRLARTILQLARYGKEDQPHGVLPKISQETLAEMIGTTRSRVNCFMNKFRKLGFIKYNGGLQINTSILSVVLHE
jgi:CRP/FNR family cyclic AMP-dependent transcriptional regulator